MQLQQTQYSFSKTRVSMSCFDSVDVTSTTRRITKTEMTIQHVNICLTIDYSMDNEKILYLQIGCKHTQKTYSTEHKHTYIIPVCFMY